MLKNKNKTRYINKNTYFKIILSKFFKGTNYSLQLIKSIQFFIIFLISAFIRPLI